MTTRKCAGCPTAIQGLSFLQCFRCQDCYHYRCMNFSKEDYNGFTQEFKDKWVCPSCRCREPKSGDNSNTPVRSPLPAAIKVPIIIESKNNSSRSPSPYDNVTLRAKSRSPSVCGCLSADIIREIIREELDRKFNNQIEQIEAKIIARLEDSLAPYKSEQEIIKSECASKSQIIEQLQCDNEKLRASEAQLTHRVQQMEQLARTTNVEIQCVPEHKSENLYTTVLQLANTIKCPLSDSDIHYCSRIAKHNTLSFRPRSVLVKFGSRRIRDTFLAGVLKFNRNNPTDKLNTSHLGIGGNKKTPVYVSEHLTPETKALHAAARIKAKEIKYRFCWVRDGKVFLRRTESTNFIVIKDLAALDRVN